MNRGAQLGEQSFTRHLENVECRGAGRRLEEWTGAAAKLQDLHVLVDEHTGRREAREQNAIGFAKDVSGICNLLVHALPFGPLARRGRLEVDVDAIAPVSLRVNLVLAVRHGEKIAEVSDRFGTSEDQQTARS